MRRKHKREITLEDGLPEYHGAKPRKRSARGKLRIMCAFVATCAACSIFARTEKFNRDKSSFIKRELETLQIDGRMCASTRHIGEEAVDAVMLFSSGQTVWSPEIVGRGAKKQITEEVVDVPGCEQTVERVRFELVRVSYREGLQSWNWKRTEWFGAEDAICIQHMIDIFNKKTTCA